MNHFHRRLDRLQRKLELRQRRHDELSRIQTIEVWCDDELREVIPLHLPYRLYELDGDGRRVYVEPDEDELALDEKIRKLVHGR